MSKPFFFRIDLVALFDFATDEIGSKMTLLRFAKELRSGQSEIPYIQDLIIETNDFIDKKKKAGRSGGLAKASSAIAKASKPKQTLAKATQSSTETEDKPYKEIIEDLNLKGGFNFKTGAATKKHIHARFSDGFTKEDFFHVHSVKIAEWGKDPKMSKFLRPETLYGNKFDSYLNQKQTLTKRVQNMDGDFIEVPL